MLRLLPNTAGALAQTFTLETGSTASGYNHFDLVSGPRTLMFRSEPSSGLGYSSRSRYESFDTEPLIADYLVVARADKLITSSAFVLTLLEKDSGGSWSSVWTDGSFDTGSLTGIRVGDQTLGQDFVQAISPSEGYGYSFDCYTSDIASHFSKLYLSSSFNFGKNPKIDPAPEWEKLPVNTYHRPYRSTQSYEVEARISLTWHNISLSTLQSFKALPHILNWPLFLYDDSQDIWDWKLEHVVVERWTETNVQDDIWNIEITFLRLKHYE